MYWLITIHAIILLIKYLKYHEKVFLYKFIQLTSVVLIVVLFFVTRGPSVYPFLDGFATRIQEKADVEQIRDWLGSLDPEIFGKMCKYGVSATGDKASIEIPEYISCIDPPISYINWFKDEENNHCVELVWGGGMHHWGLVIGPPSMEIPESETSPDRFVKKLEDGVYIWDGD